MSSPVPEPTRPQPARPPRRPLLIGVAAGVVLPLLSFVVTAWVLPDAELWWLGSLTWSAVAFAGVVMLAAARTRRYGLGVLLGFAGLLVVGAGTCTAALIALGQ